MKVAIVTIHSIFNYGSALQSFALCKYLNRNGYDAELVDYRPDYSKGLVRKIRNLAVKVLFARQYVKRAKRYDDFRRQHMRLTPRCYGTYAELAKDPPKADVYVVGSDQVWNTYFPCGRDPAFYLEFVAAPQKMSYASSLGRDNFSESELGALKEKLAGFGRISVREESGRRQLESVGLFGVQHVADPVFLLGKEDYERLLQPARYQKYMLVYAVHNDERISRIAQRIAEELGLQIILIGGIAIRCKCNVCDKTSGPVEFLSLIRHADFVLTSSFHSTAFPLIFNREFAVILPKVNASRISNILHVTGLSHRVVSGEADIDAILQPVDYPDANTRLREHIDHSRRWLLNALESFRTNGKESRS